jgi:hypothetical protein
MARQRKRLRDTRQAGNVYSPSCPPLSVKPSQGQSNLVKVAANSTLAFRPPLWEILQRPALKGSTHG